MIPRGFRREALARAGEPLDLLIVGGGVNGCGIWMEAVQRGMSALLVEKGDVASGTSSRSSKLVHGGLRYLKQGQLEVTRRSSRERDRMLAGNPELVRPMPFLYPVRRQDGLPGWMIDAGLRVYDLLSTGPSHRKVGEDEARALAPGVDLTGLDRALVYGDAWVDDARLTLAIAATAYERGGLLLTRAEVVEGIEAADGRIAGAKVRDLETGQVHAFTARVVVNAAGVWVDEVRHRLGLSGRRVRPSRGSHLVLPIGRLPLEAAVTAPSPDDRRPVFLLPFPEGVLIGTTDLYHEGPLDEPRPSADETAYLLRAARSLFPEAGLSGSDVVGAFAGLRPILGSLSERGASPSAASRAEDVWEERGLLSAAGGKLTTWRITAQAAVDAAIGLLPDERARAALPSISAVTPLAGCAPADLPRRLATLALVPAGVAEAMARRLRGAASWALTLARDERELMPLSDGTDLTAAEVRAHLAAGAVLRLEDLLLRRVRLGTWRPEAAEALVPALAPLFAQELGWDARRWEREAEAFDVALGNWRPPPVESPA